MKKQLISFLALLMMNSGALFAATSGQITLTAQQQVNNAISVVEATTAFSDLATTAESNTKIGHILVNSNDGAGFEIRLSSDKASKLVMLDKDDNYVSSPKTAQQIPYQVKVVDAGQGTKGTGINVPSEVGTLLTLDSTQTLAFVGPAETDTSGYQLDLQITTQTGSYMGGEYKDVVNIEIAEL